MNYVEQSTIRLAEGTKKNIKKIAKKGENESDVIRRYIDSGLKRDLKRKNH